MDAYRKHYERLLDPHANGALKAIDVLGTLPAAFPRHGSHTFIRLRFEHGQEKVWQFGWLDKKIQNSGQGESPFLAATPLRASKQTSGLVGWNIIWARSIQVTPKEGKGRITALEFSRPGEKPVIARRVPA